MKPRILIIGGLPRQFEAVRRRIGDRAELIHVDASGGLTRRAAQLLHSGVQAVVNTKWISHAHLDHVDLSRAKKCHGGDTTITRAVEELLV